MPNSSNVSVQNNFNGGLKTEFTGLNFPENSCTELSNCVISLIGDILRREGIDYELNNVFSAINRTNSAISTYKWYNVGGDGQTQVYVVQIGGTIYFYQITNATVASPISTTKLAAMINLSTFLVAGSNNNPNIVECQFTDGNGYLFVFHPYCDPFYCSFNSGAITPNVITVQIRDFAGIPEPGVPDSFRNPSLTTDHTYNLQNQGWTGGTGGGGPQGWQASSTTNIVVGTGSKTFTVQSGLTISSGDPVTILGFGQTAAVGDSISGSGIVSSYAGTTLVMNIVNISGNSTANYLKENWSFNNTSTGHLNVFFSAAGAYPSNSDVWWQFKDSTGSFNPSTTLGNVTINSGPAPKGYYLLNAFNQQRTTVSGVQGLTAVTTNLRPKTGTWFQGRVWYSGVDSSFPASGDQPFYTWSENIYFSQIVTNTSQFSKCYQANDPTSGDLFDLLPTDGGVIQIQGCGAIYKLFPIQTGLLVFASNGIWFITGSQGGFAANSYSISKISNVQSISSNAFANILGFPMFWNEEGIYYVAPSRQGGSMRTPDIGLDVQNIALGSFLSFYLNIPLQSKKFARGDYNPLTFVVSWVYRTTNESSVTDRYQFDGQLNYNTANKAMYPYTIANSGTSPWVHDIKYIAGPGGSTSPEPTFKYLSSIFTTGNYNFTFSEEFDSTNWKDWHSTANLNYVSNFIAGYNIKGKAVTRWQPSYVYIFSNNSTNTAYYVQGIFDYGTSGNSGKYSSIQTITNSLSNLGFVFRRHKLRGRGLVFQLAITSVDGQPFDIVGWSVFENINQGP